MNKSLLDKAINFACTEKPVDFSSVIKDVVADKLKKKIGAFVQTAEKNLFASLK